MGSRVNYDRVEREGDRASDRFGPNEKAFIAECDSFYIATVSEACWP